MANSKHDGHITETPDVSYIKNVDVNHEMSDVNVSGIVKFLAGLSVLTIVTFVLMWGLFRSLENKVTEPPRSPMALTEKDRLPPEPRLQGAPGFAEDLEKAAQAKKENKAEVSNEIKNAAPIPRDPMWEIRMVHDQWNDVLKNGPVDENGQRYGMPIEKAKEEVVKQLEQQKPGSRTQ